MRISKRFHTKKKSIFLKIKLAKKEMRIPNLSLEISLNWHRKLTNKDQKLISLDNSISTLMDFLMRIIIFKEEWISIF